MYLAKTPASQKRGRNTYNARLSKPARRITPIRIKARAAGPEKAMCEMWGKAGLLTNLKLESLLGFSDTLEMAA